MTPISASDVRRGEAGLTLFELLVVISILALAMTAIGNLARRPDQTQTVETAAQAAVNLLETARTRAIGSGGVMQVLVDTDAHQLRLSGSGRALELDPDIDLTARLAAETMTEAGAAILFFPDGTSTGGTLTLAGDTLRVEVVVDWLTGAVHAER